MPKATDSEGTLFLRLKFSEHLRRQVVIQSGLVFEPCLNELDNEAAMRAE